MGTGTAIHGTALCPLIHTEPLSTTAVFPCSGDHLRNELFTLHFRAGLLDGNTSSLRLFLGVKTTATTIGLTPLSSRSNYRGIPSTTATAWTSLPTSPTSDTGWQAASCTSRTTSRGRTGRPSPKTPYTTCSGRSSSDESQGYRSTCSSGRGTSCAAEAAAAVVDTGATETSSSAARSTYS